MPESITMDTIRKAIEGVSGRTDSGGLTMPRGELSGGGIVGGSPETYLNTLKVDGSAADGILARAQDSGAKLAKALKDAYAGSGIQPKGMGDLAGPKDGKGLAELFKAMGIRTAVVDGQECLIIPKLDWDRLSQGMANAAKGIEIGGKPISEIDPKVLQSVISQWLVRATEQRDKPGYA